LFVQQAHTVQCRKYGELAFQTSRLQINTFFWLLGSIAQPGMMTKFIGISSMFPSYIGPVSPCALHIV